MELSLLDALEKETREKENVARNAQEILPHLLGAVQVLLRTLNGFLADVLSKGLATVEYDKTRLEPELWNTVFFPVLKIHIRKQVVMIVPYGPVMRSRCRVDMSCGLRKYFMFWDGQGNAAENWTIKPSENLTEAPIALAKESFDQALETLIGLRN
jgi:hypothetical protein